jgi:ribosome-binding protein aMBF1 (putative translation factor)
LDAVYIKNKTHSLFIYQFGTGTLSGMRRILANKPQPLETRFAEERDQVQAAFGIRLRKFRTEKKLTLEMLAERAGLHAHYVGAVERGERNLSLYNIWRLAHGLDLNVTELMQELPKRKA